MAYPTRFALAAAMASLLAQGCSGGGATGGGSDAASAQDAGPGPPTFSAIYDGTLSLSCAVPFCHAGLSVMPLSTKDQSYQQLVNMTATGPYCGSTGMKRVDPGNPATSLLYLKIASTHPSCGAGMPPMNSGGPLLPGQVQQIKEWITLGAKNN